MKGKRIMLSVVLFFSALCGAKAEHQTCAPPVKAGNFTYTLSSGQKDSLYALTSEWVLLYFYEPTCEDCRLLTEQIAGSEILRHLFAEKKLQVLAIYPDNDRELWKSHASHLPQQWINGYDEHLSIIPESNYLFRSLPALYLLDKEKYIRLHETTLEAIEKEISKVRGIKEESNNG